MNEDIVVPIAGMVMIIVIVFGSLGFVALRRKWELQAQRPKLPDDMAPRLERMEAAIDAMAIEIERISEGQRFTTKLLTERQKEPAMLPNQSDLPR